MAKVDITIPGERIVESFTALVPQPTAPSTARAPDVGLVELSYVNPTVLVPGPPGPPGPAGSRWYTGVGDPTTPGTNFGDMYLNDTDGTIWTWNGTAWVDTGTDLSPDASELLIKIKTVDGSGSGLDADTLDGHDSLYFAPIASPVFTGDPKAPTPAPGDSDTSIATTAFVSTSVGSINWGSLPGKPATFPPTLPIAESDVTNLVSDLALKAPLASPTFTGDPKAPTPAAADNDTSIATTAFVKTTVNTAVGGIVPFPEAPVDGLTYGRKNAAWATIVGGAVVSDTAPGGPLQTGQLWWESDSGNTYIWVVDAGGGAGQWVQQNILPPYVAPPPLPPNDGGEYVMVNGVWRLSKQTFDLGATVDQKIIVPDWNPKQARFSIWARAVTVGGGAAIYMQVSADGVIYFSGASDYGYAGYSHFTGATSPGMGIVPDTITSAVPIWSTTDVDSVPARATVEMNLRKASTGNSRWGWSSRGAGYGSGASIQYHQLFVQGRYKGADTTTVQMRGIRFYSGSTFIEGNINVEWL